MVHRPALEPHRTVDKMAAIARALVVGYESLLAFQVREAQLRISVSVPLILKYGTTLGTS